MTYLVDTSALTRILKMEETQAWRVAAKRGCLMICEPVMVEMLVGVGASRYDVVKAKITEDCAVCAGAQATADERRAGMTG